VALRVGPRPRPLTRGDWLWDSAHDRVAVRVGGAVGTFSRGMLAEVAVTLDQWYDLAGPALAAWPVERATIVGAPGLSFAVAP
jgi:hypothetical protein